MVPEVLSHILVERDGIPEYAISGIGSCGQNTAFRIVSSRNAWVRGTGDHRHVIQNVRYGRQVFGGGVIEPGVDRVQIGTMQPKRQTDTYKSLGLGSCCCL